MDAKRLAQLHSIREAQCAALGTLLGVKMAKPQGVRIEALNEAMDELSRAGKIIADLMAYFAEQPAATPSALNQTEKG